MAPASLLKHEITEIIVLFGCVGLVELRRFSGGAYWLGIVTTDRSDEIEQNGTECFWYRADCRL